MLNQDDPRTPPAAGPEHMTLTRAAVPAEEPKGHSLRAGQQIGDYRLVRKIGEGGMGVLFEAVHQHIGRRVAIKVLRLGYASDPALVARLFNEARAVNLVEHPGIVGIFEFGQLGDGTAYLVMEYLAGESLAARLIRGGGRLGDDVLHVSRQIAAALAAAHERNIVHRDLKPDNVMLVSDPEAAGGERAKLLDFGIAKMISQDGDEAAWQRTRTSMVMGTPTYMAPEQCRGSRDVDDKADVYSLGVMMYQMLAGQPPFVSSGVGEIMAMHLYAEVPRLKGLMPSISPYLAALVETMLAKAPAERPTMREIIAGLEALGARPSAGRLPTQAVHAGRLPGPQPAAWRSAAGERPSVRRTWPWAAVVAVGVALGLLMGAWGLDLLRHRVAPPADLLLPAPRPAAPERQLSPARWSEISESTDDVHASSQGGLSPTGIGWQVVPVRGKGAAEIAVLLRCP